MKRTRCLISLPHNRGRNEGAVISSSYSLFPVSRLPFLPPVCFTCESCSSFNRLPKQEITMDTQSYVDGSLRPYVSRTDFDLQYPIAYQPEIGIINTGTSQSISQTLPIIQSQHGSSVNNISNNASKIGIHGFGSRVKSSTYASMSNKEPFGGKSVNDLEWNEFLDITNLKSVLLGLSKRFIQGWLRCLISQPFDVVRILLQVGSFKSNSKNLKSVDVASNKEKLIDVNEDNEFSESTDSDISDSEGRDAYFVSNSPVKLHESKIERKYKKTIRRKSNNSMKSIESSKNEIIDETNGNPKTKKINIVIEPESLNTFDMINSLLTKEGPRGILKSVNTTFLMRTLHYTLESWFTGFISGLFGIPDPIFVDMIHSPNINLSLILSIFSNVLASLVLTQLNLIRIKFIVTTSSRGCRSFREIISNIPRFHLFTIPKSLLIPSIITNFIKSFTLHYPEYLLTTMRINKYNNPYIYNMSSVILKIIGLFIRLPFETIYTRAQVNYLLSNKEDLPKAMRIDRNDMCIEFGGYYGYLSTIYYILMGSKPVQFEGQSLETEVDENEENRGIQAIFRGWKVGLLRLISNYTLSLLRDDKYNIHEERF